MALAETALPATAITKNRRLVRTDGVVMAHGASMRTERAIERKQDQGTRRTALDNGRDFLGRNGIIDGNTSVRLDIMPHP